MSKTTVTIWNEFIHEQKDEKVKKVYPDGIHRKIAQMLGDKYNYQFATQDMPEHGLTQDVLAKTDVLIWWAHVGHAKVEDAIVDRVQQRVLEGMGLILLHSAHYSKIFKRLMGTGCGLRWREANEKERLWTVEPFHPIAKGIPQYFELPNEEMYGERFDIPDPDKVVFISWFEGGEVFRSGVTYTRGMGKVFYFRPGHETHPTFHNPTVIKVIENAIDWAKYEGATDVMKAAPNIKVPLETIRSVEPK
ncbi:MAG: ThuA domain-containing protein [Spirochaetes bacterium]|nr:ThuA domain-containing protein [Spirochaetota bacterium]